MYKPKLSPDQELRLSARAAKAARASYAASCDEMRPVVEVFCSDTYGTRVSEQALGIDPVTGEVIYAIADATVTDQENIFGTWRIPDARKKIADAMALKPGQEVLTPVLSFRINEEGLVRARLERALTLRRVQDRNKNVARDLKAAAVKAGILDKRLQNEAIGYLEIALADACMADLVSRTTDADTDLLPITNHRFTAPLRTEKSLHNLHVAAYHHRLYGYLDVFSI